MCEFTWGLATAVAGTQELHALLQDGWEPFSIAQVIMGQNSITRETQMGILIGLKKMLPKEPNVKLS